MSAKLLWGTAAMINDTVIYIGSVTLLLGAAFCLLAALGILRLPDLASRAHAASKAGVVGGGFVLMAVALLGFDLVVAVRAILGIIFLMLTTPLATHMLISAAYRADDKMRAYLALDETRPKS